MLHRVDGEFLRVSDLGILPVSSLLSPDDDSPAPVAPLAARVSTLLAPDVGIGSHGEAPLGRLGSGLSGLRSNADDSFLADQKHAAIVHVPLAPAVYSGPPQTDETAFIGGVDATGKVAGTGYYVWNGDNPATYSAPSSAHKWGSGTVGTAGGTITYAFAAGWSATETTAFTAGLTLWSDLANISFSLVASSASPDILITRGSDGKAVTNASWTGDVDSGAVGGTKLWQMTHATVSIDTSVPSFGPIGTNPAEYSWTTLLHEEGHAIGLGHAGPYNGDDDPITQQFSAWDNWQWSIMSYIEPNDSSAKYFADYAAATGTSGTNWGVGTDGFDEASSTPMMLDIQAVQRMYGASTSGALAGGQVFGFHCNISDAASVFYDFNIDTKPVVTIWDSGSNNTLDFSGFSSASTVNLNAGTFSSCDGMTNNIAIAVGTVINTFVGGSGDDTVTANDNGDLIRTGAGNDSVTGGSGNDGIYFGATLTALDTVNGGGGTNNQLGLEGDYSSGVTLDGARISNIQTVAMMPGFNYNITTTNSLVGTGQTMSVWWVSTGATNSVTFDASADTDSNFRFFMGQGGDTVTGGGGNDLFYGEGGADTMRGNAGVDTYAYLAATDSTGNSNGTAYDKILDFNANIDRFKFPVGVAAVDTAVTGGTLSAASFDTDLATAIGSGQLHAGDAVLFTPSLGGLANHPFLIVDGNGTAGYQTSGMDYVIDLFGGTNLGALSTANFT